MLTAGKKIGVDAGTALVKVVEVAKGKDGVSLASWSALPFRVPANSTPDATRKIQANAIDAAIKKSECRCRDIVVGVPGNSAFIRNIKLPPIPSSKIDQIVRYEIQQTIPFPIETIALDYQVLEPDASSEVEVIMVAMKGEVAESFIRDIEQAKVKVGIVDSIPIALYNCYLYNGYSSKDECTAIIEIGAATTNILIELGGELRYSRSVGIAGNDITKAIAKEFNIPLEQAERLKSQHGLIFPQSQESAATQDQVRLSRTIAAVLDRLVGEIKLTIGYFRSLTGATAISRTVLAGGTSLLKNIRPFLAERLGVQVEILNPFKKINVPKNLVAVRKVAPLLGTAVGLALRSSQDCCQLKISLIPPKVKEAKSRRSRVLYNAASIVLAVGIIGLVLWRLLPTVRDRAALIAKLDTQIARYEKYEPELTKLKTEKGTLLGEYVLYSKYTTKTLDVTGPLVMLTDCVDNNTWITDIKVGKKGTYVSGLIKSDTKVDELRSLSNLRLRIEKYCKQVKVRKQAEATDGLQFEFELMSVVDLPQYLALRQAEEKKAAQPEKAAEGQKASEPEKAAEGQKANEPEKAPAADKKAKTPTQPAKNPPEEKKGA